MINPQSSARLTDSTDTMIGEIRVTVDRTGSLIVLEHQGQTMTVARTEVGEISALLVSVVTL